MKSRILYTLLALCGLVLSSTRSRAETVDLTAPGTLEERITAEQAASLTTLTVSGAMNAADFDYINKAMLRLITLDLGGARIEAYSGGKVLLGRTESAADAVPDFAFAGSSVQKITLPASVTSIGEGAFSASALTSADFSALVNLRSIGTGAFSGSPSLKNVAVPQSVTGIGAHAFSRCPALTEAALAGSADIPASAFEGSAALNTVTLAAEVKNIGKAAFRGCAALKSISLPGSLASVEASAFEQSGLTSADLSATVVKSIGDWAFSRCEALQTVILPPSLSQLGAGCFFEDKALVAVAIPSGVTTVPDYCFKGDNSLDTDGFLHPAIISIGDFALMGLDNVEKLALPQALAKLGTECMADWTALSELNVTALSVVPELGENVWKGVDQPSVQLKVSKELADEYSAAPQWQDFHIEISSGIEDVAEDTTGADIKAWFEGTDLVLQSMGSPIEAIRMFNVSGTLLLAASPADNLYTISTGDLSDRIYLLRVTLSDGKSASVKIAR